LVGLTRDQIDPKVVEHARFVDPVIVRNLKKWFNDDGDFRSGWNGPEVFKHVFRFWKVLKAYQSKREGWSREKAKRVLDKLKSTFGGDTPAPTLLLLFGR